MKKLFKDNFKYLRAGKGLSQFELGKALTVSTPTIGHYESGYSEPNIDMLIKIAAFFEVTVGQLVGTEELV